MIETKIKDKEYEDITDEWMLCGFCGFPTPDSVPEYVALSLEERLENITRAENYWRTSGYLDMDYYSYRRVLYPQIREHILKQISKSS